MCHLLELRSCTNVSNGLEARSTKNGFSCGVGILPAHERLIENGARSQLEPKVMLQLVLLHPIARSQAQLLDTPTIPKIPSGFSDVFVYGRSQKFSAKLAKMQKSKIELLEKPKTLSLWVGKLVKE